MMKVDSIFCVDPSNREYGPPVTLTNAAEFTRSESFYRVPGSIPEQRYHSVEYGAVYKVRYVIIWFYTV